MRADTAQEIIALRARVVSLTEALRYYAQFDGEDAGDGEVARAALAGVGEGTPETRKSSGIADHFHEGCEICRPGHTDPTPPPFNPDPNLAGYLFTNEKPEPE
jgi:hypothetical protein